MLTRIAWRNVWRSPGRSGTIIAAVAVGVASLAFLIGFMNGFIESFVDNGIKTDYSHVQIHHPDFIKDSEIKFDIANADQISKDILSLPNVESVTQRTISNGMISSPKGANGITIYGIDPEMESATTTIDSAVVEGTYFQTIKRNPILISKETAEKLKLKLRSKVVLTFQDEHNEIIAGSFRVEGIFESTSPRINKGVVFVRATDLARLIGGDVKIHEIAVLANSMEAEPHLTDTLTAIHQNLLVRSWADLAPELKLTQGQSMMSLSIVLIIIMGALCFGIINTMLMAVLERVRELGMLMAVGMKKTRVFAMIVLETLMMTIVGGPLGIFIGWAINHYFIVNGLDLSAYSEGLKDLGYENVLYPKVNVSDYVIIAIAVALTAIIAAIYPARKATRLKPVEALHTI